MCSVSRFLIKYFLKHRRHVSSKPDHVGIQQPMDRRRARMPQYQVLCLYTRQWKAPTRFLLYIYIYVEMLIHRKRDKGIALAEGVVWKKGQPVWRHTTNLTFTGNISSSSTSKNVMGLNQQRQQQEGKETAQQVTCINQGWFFGRPEIKVSDVLKHKIRGV